MPIPVSCANFVVLIKSLFFMGFQNQKIVIAGGSSGIGLAAARRFARAGAQVTITGRNKEKLAAAKAEGLNAQGTDGRDRGALDKLFADTGAFDHLVITSGGSKGMGEFAGLSLEVLQEGFAEKFWPQLETLQAALPYLREGGSVTLVTAISATGKMPGTSGLAAINGALEIMVPILAKELKKIRINAVSPGVVDTPWWNFLPADSRAAVLAEWTAAIPARRAAQPEEIADVIAFLAGNEYMTGKAIGCDGGLC